jgi:hypothetical protein
MASLTDLESGSAVLQVGLSAGLLVTRLLPAGRIEVGLDETKLGDQLLEREQRVRRRAGDEKSMHALCLDLLQSSCHLPCPVPLS